MTLMDFTLDAPEQQPSVDVKRSATGYSIREAKMEGWRIMAARAATAALCFGMMAAGGMVWTLADASFPGDPSMTKTILSTAIYIVAAALVVNGAFASSRDEVQVNVKDRVLHVLTRAPYGMLQSRRTFRFEEISRIELSDADLMTELRGALSRWDYGKITLTAGQKHINLFGGDMMDLEPLLRRLRQDAGVA